MELMIGTIVTVEYDGCATVRGTLRGCLPGGRLVVQVCDGPYLSLYGEDIEVDADKVMA